MLIYPTLAWEEKIWIEMSSLRVGNVRKAEESLLYGPPCGPGKGRSVRGRRPRK